jgi:hypothetical protein
MELSSRLFYCALCHAQCIICSPCDNGQIYCSPDCSRSARQKSCNEAEKRYQKTEKGRLNHALRQQRYRERQCKIVTDHTCQTPSECDPYSSTENKTDKSFINQLGKNLFCCCCGKPVSNWIRHDFLNQTMRSRASSLLFCNRPP